MSSRLPRPARGFLLLEVVLALGIFGIAATGFTVALHRMAQAASMAQKELEITRILDSRLDEELSQPQLQEGVHEVQDGDIQLATRVEAMTEMQNEKGQLLQEMYHLRVTARWYEGGAWQERFVETWRYGRMYQP